MGLTKLKENVDADTVIDESGEFFYCESLPDHVLMTKGRKVLDCSDMNHPFDNSISNGSMIAVGNHQCVVIVDEGKIADFSMEPGIFIYNPKTEPSMYSRGQEELVKSMSSFKKEMDSGKPITAWQNVYYVNTKEIRGNKISSNNTPFRDGRYDAEIFISYMGEFSYRIVNPVLFYKNIAGDASVDFQRAQWDKQLIAEIQLVMKDVLGSISHNNYIPYETLSRRNARFIVDELNKKMKSFWREVRGIEVYSLSISDISLDEESERKLLDIKKELGEELDVAQ